MSYLAWLVRPVRIRSHLTLALLAAASILVASGPVRAGEVENVLREAIGADARVVGGIAKVAQDEGQKVIVTLYQSKEDGIRVGRFEQLKGRWRPVWQSEDLIAVIEDGKTRQVDADGDGKPDFVFGGCKKGACCKGFAHLVVPRSGPAAWLIKVDASGAKVEAAMEVSPGSPKSRKVYDFLIAEARKTTCGPAIQTAIGGVPF
jgi:hypothetical protein